MTTTEAAAEPAVDIAEFVKTVAEFISGPWREENYATVQVAYGKLEPRRGKYAARQYLAEMAREAVETGDLKKARGAFSLSDRLSAAPRLRKPSASDPTKDQIFRVLSIQLGYSLAAVERNVPPGVDPSWSEHVASTPQLEHEAQTYRNWIEGGRIGKEPEVSDVAKAGARISLGRAPKGQGRRPKDA